MQRPDSTQLFPLVSCFWCERPHSGRHPLSVCPACTGRLGTMRLLEMRGAYPLTAEAIDDVLKRERPGNYALGYMDGGAFDVFFVGRSDSDVRGRLRDWIGKPAPHDRFASPAKAAWELRSRGTNVVPSPALGRVSGNGSEYTHFAYSYAASVDDAYAKEWRNYDTFGGRAALDNELQPASAVA